MQPNDTAEKIVREVVEAFEKDALHLLQQHCDELRLVVAAEVSDLVEEKLEAALRRAIDGALQEKVAAVLNAKLSDFIADATQSMQAAQAAAARSVQPAAAPDAPRQLPLTSVEPAAHPPTRRAEHWWDRRVPTHILLWVVLGTGLISIVGSIAFQNWSKPESRPQPSPRMRLQQDLPLSNDATKKESDPIAEVLKRAEVSNTKWPERRYCSGIQADLDRLAKGLPPVPAKKEHKDSVGSLRKAIDNYRKRKLSDDDDHILIVALLQQQLPNAGPRDGLLDWVELSSPKGSTAPALAKHLNDEYLPTNGVPRDGNRQPLQRLADHRGAPKFTQLLDRLMRDILSRRCNGSVS